MVDTIAETILERTVNGVDMICGFNRLTPDSEFTPFINIGGKITQFDDITKARSAFWESVKAG